MAEPNAEVARRGFEAVLRGELEPIADLLAADVRWHGGDPSAPEACRSRKEALEVIRAAIERGAVGELSLSAPPAARARSSTPVAR